VADEDIRRLGQAILDYFDWLSSTGKPKKNRLRERYRYILIEFLIFAVHEEIAWKDMFTFDTLRVFKKYFVGLKGAGPALISFSRYLYEGGRIAEPLEIPNHQIRLPDTYEQYLLYLQQGKAVSKVHVGSSRRVLASLHAYLEHHNIALSALKIEHLDAFLTEFNKPFSTVTRRIYRSKIRGFLKYLYDEKVLGKHLAQLLVGPRVFNQSKPPRFLRPQEVTKLFGSLTLDTSTQIRTYAMVLLAYSLGLRPAEISQITLDDISFQRGELTIRKRKTNNPVVLPIPDTTLKAVAAYVHKIRPETPYRELFLTRHRPYRPASSKVVIHHISKIMKEAGLSSSAYWLRHSYAQSLLRIGRSIYDIKEMLGHENIRSTQRYLHINTELMRKVLFDETL